MFFILYNVRYDRNDMVVKINNINWYSWWTYGINSFNCKLLSRNIKEVIMATKTPDLKWNYRIIKRKTEAFEDVEAQDYYSIEEVFYDTDGNPEMHTSDIGVGAPTLEELKELVERLNTAVANDVIDEIIPEEE